VSIYEIIIEKYIKHMGQRELHCPETVLREHLSSCQQTASDTNISGFFTATELPGPGAYPSQGASHPMID
jgi:hypothetical protein